MPLAPLNPSPGSAMDQTSTRRLMLTVQDVVGKGSDGPPFWSPQFTKGFVEVKFGKMRTEKVSTAAQDMEDFELSFNEELAVDMDANCQELVVSVVSGEVDNPGPVLARCGACSLWCSKCLRWPYQMMSIGLQSSEQP
ncbi:unnamed protein product [Ostreobium quekettii]|uniref:C2 domain-containing protein n=1 Tax=Ostreobium quekettii TaxID=121088 RepID=A0A8S1IV14_9CHLO|nr:unnamed protein product [Ostreobium quekettii]